MASFVLKRAAKIIFVHRRVLEAAGIKHLRKGQRVSFDQANDLGRPFATNLRLANKAGPKRSTESHSVFKACRIQMRLAKSRTSLFESRSSARLLSNRWRMRFVAVAPECQAFVGVIIERVVPETSDGANWAVKGVRYGRADRDRCEAALGMSLHEKQLEYTLSDEQKRS